MSPPDFRVDGACQYETIWCSNFRVRSRSATSQLDHVFYALSDPTRRDILTALTRQQANLTQLAHRSKLSFTAVAKHLKVLERGKLVRRRIDQHDRRAVMFELRPRPMQTGIDWLEKHRHYWQTRFAELSTFVSANYVPHDRSLGAERTNIREEPSAGARGPRR
jgi:DNA-binding transcriptional ArsR family regulator